MDDAASEDLWWNDEGNRVLPHEAKHGKRDRSSFANV
jgi:hypothetical protein